jgi:hypothetical protein
MKTSRAFMTVVPLALILIGTLAVLVAATRGAFSFDRWPDAPQSMLSEREVVVDVPVAAEPTARADARRRPAADADGATVVVKAPKPGRLDRREAPATTPSVPQVVADTGPEPVPEADGDGATADPVDVESAPEGSSRGPLPLPETPALPELPAKQLPDEEPDQRLPEWAADHAVLPRGLRDDQE